MKKVILTIATAVALMSCTIDAPQDCDCGVVKYKEVNQGAYGNFHYYYIEDNCTGNVSKVQYTWTSDLFGSEAGDLVCDYN